MNRKLQIENLEPRLALSALSGPTLAEYVEASAALDFVGPVAPPAEIATAAAVTLPAELGEGESLSPWNNAALKWDVDNDGIIAPIDAMIVINELHGHAVSNNLTGRLPTPTSELHPPPFYDVNDDNYVSPIDALMVINYINNHP